MGERDGRGMGRIGVSDGSAAAPAPRPTRRDLRDAAGGGDAPNRGRRRRRRARSYANLPSCAKRRDAVSRRVGESVARGGRVSESGAARGGRLAPKSRTRARSVGDSERPGAGLDLAQPGRWASTATVAEPRARFIRTRTVDRLASVARCETAPRPSQRHARRRSRARSSLPRRGVPRRRQAAPVRLKPLARRASNSRSPWRPRCSAS